MHGRGLRQPQREGVAEREAGGRRAGTSAVWSSTRAPVPATAGQLGRRPPSTLVSGREKRSVSDWVGRSDFPSAGCSTAASGWPVGNQVTRTGLVSSPRCGPRPRRGCCRYRTGQRARQRDDALAARGRLPGDLVAAEDRDRTYGVEKRTCTGLPCRVWIQCVSSFARGVVTVMLLRSCAPTSLRAQPGRSTTIATWIVSSRRERPFGQIQPLAVVRTGSAEPSSAVTRTDMIFVPQPDVCTRASACGAAARRVEGNCVRTYAAAARAPTSSSRKMPPTTHSQTRRRFGGIWGEESRRAREGPQLPPFSARIADPAPACRGNGQRCACRAGSRPCRLPGLPAVREVAGDAASVPTRAGAFLVARSVCGAEPFREGRSVNAPVIPVPAPHGVLRAATTRAGSTTRRSARSRRRVAPRSHYAGSSRTSRDGRPGRRRAAEVANRSFLHQGVTFTSTDDGRQRADLPLRPVPADDLRREWAAVEAGLQQRITALNLFLHDIYHDQKILRDGVIPRRAGRLGAHFRREFVGIDAPRQPSTSTSPASTSSATSTGAVCVLEDNLRTPERRLVRAREPPDDEAGVPRPFAALGVRPVDHYPGQLLDNLSGSRRAARPGAGGPTVVVLTPGIYNSAYFEHASSRSRWASSSSRAATSFVTTTASTCARRAAAQVDVIYRRIDDEFLDPMAFRPTRCSASPG